MLVSDGQFTVPELPGIFIYPDSASPESFYAIPARPRLAWGDSGSPEISLLIRTKKINNQTEVTGGFLTLSIALGLVGQEEAALISSLTRKIAADWPADSDQPPPKPRLLAINWLKTDVQLTLDPKTVVPGQPSAMGDNRCSFSITLNAEQAKALQTNWQQGKMGLSARYLVRIQAGPPSGARAEFSNAQTASVSGNTMNVQSAVSFAASQSTSIPLELDLQGALELSGSDLKRSLNEMNL